MMQSKPISSIMARAGNASAAKPRRRAGRSRAARLGLQRALDAVTAVPAFVLNGRTDSLAVNSLGKAFSVGVSPPPVGNLARFSFLNPAKLRIFHLD
jgi:hypothetical protein